MLAHPGSRRIKCTPVGAINGSGCTPYICIVMGHPTSCTIHVFCCLLTRNGHVLYHLNEWFMQFGKIGFFCWPIIHFCIDVDGVFAIPWRIDFIVPNSLEVCSLATWLGRRN